MKLAKAMMILALAGTPLAINAQEHLKSLDPKGLDKTVAPGADFYQHVNSG